MKCGYAKKTINPPLGTPIVGYYRERLTKGIIDDLCVRAAAFDDGSSRSVVIAIDLCLLNAATCTQIRQSISDYCGLPMDAIFLSCNHTHTGPLTTPDFASDKQPDPEYMAFLRWTIRDAAAEALKDLKPAAFYSAVTSAKDISFVRRYRMKDGSVRTNPAPLDPNIDHPLAEPNETLRLLKICREGGDDLFIVNFGVHADTVGGEYISADYSGYLCSTIEGAIPNTQCMFLLAPQGDVNHLNPFRAAYGKVISPKAEQDYREAAAHARYMGRVLAGNILAVCDRAERIQDSDIRFGSLEVEVPSHQENDRLEEAIRINDLYESGREDELNAIGMHKTAIIAEARRIIRLQNGPESFSFRLFAMRIGDFVFAGLPGEPFTHIHNGILAGSPFQNIMVCCLVNASSGYFPSTQAYTEGGYEVLTSSFAPGTAEIIIDGMTRLLKTLA